MAGTSLATDARAREDRAIYRALRIVERRAGEPGELVNDPFTAGNLFRLSLAGEEREHFEAAFLDSRHRLLARERLFSGTVAAASVHPRIVVQRALFHNAAAVMVAHNHPSGEQTPSGADFDITRSLWDALALVEVRLLDHFIIGRDAPFSFARAGMFDDAPEQAARTAKRKRKSAPGTSAKAKQQSSRRKPAARTAAKAK